MVAGKITPLHLQTPNGKKLEIGNCEIRNWKGAFPHIVLRRSFPEGIPVYSKPGTYPDVTLSRVSCFLGVYAKGNPDGVNKREMTLVYKQAFPPGIIRALSGVQYADGHYWKPEAAGCYRSIKCRNNSP